MRKWKSLKPLFAETWNRHKGALILCAAVIVALVGCLLLVLCAPADPESAHAAEGAGVDIPVGGIANAEVLVDDARAQDAAENEEMTRRMEEIYEYLVQLDTMVTDNQSTLEEVRLQGDADLQEEETVSEVQDKLRGDVVNLGTRMTDLHEEITSTKELITMFKESTADGQTVTREQIASTFTQLESAVQTIGREFDREIADVEKLIEAFRGDDASRHQTVIQTLTEMKSGMETSQKESFDAVNDSLEQMRESYAKAVKDLQSNVQTGFDTLTEGMDGYNDRLNKLNTALTEGMNGNNDRLDALETGNGEVLTKLEDYHQWVKDSFTSVSNGKQAVTAALLTKNIPVINTGENGELLRFSDLERAIQDVCATADDTIAWRVDGYGGGDNAPSLATGNSASVKQNDYAMQLGLEQQVTIPAGYYDRDAVIRNAIRNNGTLTQAFADSGLADAAAYADGYYTDVKNGLIAARQSGIDAVRADPAGYGITITEVLQNANVNVEQYSVTGFSEVTFDRTGIYAGRVGAGDWTTHSYAIQHYDSALLYDQDGNVQKVIWEPGSYWTSGTTNPKEDDHYEGRSTLPDGYYTFSFEPGWRFEVKCGITAIVNGSLIYFE